MFPNKERGEQELVTTEFAVVVRLVDVLKLAPTSTSCILVHLIDV